MNARNELQRHLTSQDYDALEETWLSLVSEGHQDLEAFLTAADALERASHSERARTLLEVLDDSLTGDERWEQRLVLLQRAGRRYIRTGKMHETVMETIHQTYSHRGEELRTAMGIVGLDKSRDETPKLWDKVERLRNLLTYEVGTVVAMPGKGVGRVVEVNVQLQTLKVDFEQHKGLAVGFRVAGKSLELLSPEHVLRRKLEDPESLLALGPSELLREVLLSYGRPLTAGEVKEAVAGVVPTNKWSSWWTAARKDSRILAEGNGSRQTYRFAEGEDAADHLWQQFEGADLDGRLELLRKAANQESELRQRMATELAEEATSIRASDPASAFVVWNVLERGGMPPSWELSEIVGRLSDPSAFLDELPNRSLKERAYDLLREQDGWDELFSRRVSSESDPRLIGRLMEALADGAPTTHSAVVERVLAQPSRAPEAFLWLLERVRTDEALHQERGARLLRQLVYAIDDPALADRRARLCAHVESGGAAPKLFDVLSPEQAQEIWNLIDKVRGLEEYQKTPLRNALHLRHPSLGHEEREQPLYTTGESLAVKREELRRLLEDEIPANRKAIKEAREMGDLRENFEYKAARQRHEYLTALATSLNEQLKQAQVLDPDSIDPSEVRIGTRVELRSGDAARTYSILGPWESDPARGIISFQSELAQSLLGKGPGDELQIEGQPWRVESIERWR